MVLVKQSGWHASEGRITAVNVECGMRARKGDYEYTKTIACELVDVFKELHSDKTWTVTRKYNATVQFTGVDGAAETQMTLYARDGQPPIVGDTFPVLQNPEDKTEVVRPDAGSTLTLTIGAGMLGAAILYFLFRRKPAPRTRPEGTHEEPANENARNDRADAMIAAALARRAAEARTATPSPLVVRSGTPQARSFGRKR